VVVGGVEEKHTEGRHFLNSNNQWIDVGTDALDAQRKRLLRLNQMEYARLSGKSLTAASPEQLGVVEFSGRKIVKDEVEGYLADLELAKRPYKTVGDKRRFLTSFLRIVPKKFVDEFSRNDVLTFRNELMVDYDPEYVGKQMMAVVTFFNQWLRLKLNIQKCDWPEHEQNPPEPYIDAEIVGLETHTKGKTNLLVRLFRSTGCRDMEVAHLTDADISPRTKEILIRQKPCFHCKECISRGNIWKPKTPASTRSIPVSDGLLAELLAMPKGLLFPNEDGNPDVHFLDKLKRKVKNSGVAHVKLQGYPCGPCPNQRPRIVHKVVCNACRNQLRARHHAVARGYACMDRVRCLPLSGRHLGNEAKW
jgi:hypothetical protein